MQKISRLLGVLVLTVGMLTLANPAHAMLVDWVNWTSADTTTASGVAAVKGVDVNFSGSISPEAQTSGGINYWAINPSLFMEAGLADNPPPDSDIVRLTGGSGTGVQTLTFSKPVVDPFMAIMSLGRSIDIFGPVDAIVDYDFDASFDVIKYGAGYWGGPGTLTEFPGDVLRGEEGHGLIQFKGTYSSISWTIPTAEYWHGFQVGIGDVVTPVPEPATMALLGSGLIGALLRRKKNNA